MINSGKALYQFFSSFGIPAYDSETVPDDAKLPYITYTPEDSDWRETVSVSASVWYFGTDLAALFQKVDEIKNKVGEGYRVPTEDGCLWINKDNPFAQRQPTDDDNVKVVYLLFSIHMLTK